MPFPYRSLSLLAATSLVAAPSSPHDHDPLALHHVVVTAHPYARAQLDLVQPTNVLAGRQLDLRQAPTLGELLGGEPGISSTWFGPGSSRPIIRGLGGDRLRILQNGIGTIDASVTSPDHAVALDPLLIERVEVVRGPASLLYGSSAVGGVVNVISHRIHTSSPDRPLVARFEGRYRSVNDERSGGAVLEGGVGSFAWHLDGFRRQAGDVRIPGYAESARLRAAAAAEHEEDHPDDDHDEPVHGRIPNTRLESDGAAGGWSFIHDRGYVGFAFSGLNSFYGIPAGAHVDADDDHDDHDEEDGHDEADHGPVQVDLRQRRLDVEGEWQIDAAGLRSTRFKFSRADYRHQELEDDEVGTIFENQGYEGRWELLHEPIGRFTGAAGLQVARSRFNAIGDEAFVPPSRTHQQAIFLFEEAEFQPFTWQLGARAERQDITVRDGSGRQRDDRGFSASTGLIWAFDPAWSITSAVTRTERPPNAQELYADGPHAGTGTYEIGADDLGRETSVGFDVSLRRRTGGVTGSLTVFMNRFDGYIFEQLTDEEEDGLPVARYVQRDARLTGAEIETVWHLHEAHDQLFDVVLGADLVRGRNTTDRENLPRITPPRVRAGLEWQRGLLSGGTEVQRVFRQDRTAPEETATSGYVLVSAHLGWRLLAGARTLDVFVQGTNLTNREARMHTSFLKELAPLPGRNVTVGLRASF
jgi:iron complex outermembrane recepter protein